MSAVCAQRVDRVEIHDLVLAGSVRPLCQAYPVIRDQLGDVGQIVPAIDRAMDSTGRTIRLIVIPMALTLQAAILPVLAYVLARR